MQQNDFLLARLVSSNWRGEQFDICHGVKEPVQSQEYGMDHAPFNRTKLLIQLKP